MRSTREGDVLRQAQDTLPPRFNYVLKSASGRRLSALRGGKFSKDKPADWDKSRRKEGLPMSKYYVVNGLVFRRRDQALAAKSR